MSYLRLPFLVVCLAKIEDCKFSAKKNILLQSFLEKEDKKSYFLLDVNFESVIESIEKIFFQRKCLLSLLCTVDYSWEVKKSPNT